MATKREERQAFRKLQEAFPSEYVSLDHIYNSLEEYYSAYHEGKTELLRAHSLRANNYAKMTNPMEPVDYLIQLQLRDEAEDEAEIDRMERRELRGE